MAGITVWEVDRGLSISAVWSPAIAISCASIPLPPSAFFAPFSRHPTFALRTRPVRRDIWSTKGYATRYETALEVLKSLPYDRWRQTQPEDTVRFHALRLRELGMIKSSPQKIIAEGADWRFLSELKKELKA